MSDLWSEPELHHVPTPRWVAVTLSALALIGIAALAVPVGILWWKLVEWLLQL